MSTPTPIPPRPDTGAPIGAGPGLPGGRVRSTWGWFESVGVYLLAFLIAGFAEIPILAAMGGLETERGGIGPAGIVATIAADIVITIVLVSWLARWHKEWREAMVLSPPRETVGRHVLFGAICGVILVPAVGVISSAIATLFEQVVGHAVTAPEQVQQGLPLGAKLGLVLLAVVVAPISEELFFRGVLFRTVRDRHGFWAAGLASAVPFGLVHWVPAPAIDALLLQVTMVFTGLGLAWIYERRGTLVANVAAHMAFNVIGLITIIGLVR